MNATWSVINDILNLFNHLSPLREKMRKLGISQEDVNDAVAWARKNNK